MKKVLILTAHVEGLSHIPLDISQYDGIICADGGLTIAEELGITPDLLIGDYDSMAQPENQKVIKLPMEKDMTDSEAALDLALSQGAQEVTVLGGLGGRLDHTMGNLGLLSKYCRSLKDLAFVDGCNRVSLLLPGAHTIPKNRYHYMGLIAYGGEVEGLTIRGAKYPLTNHTLQDDTSLGVSNEITASAATVEFTKGRLLLIFSNDAPSD